MQHKNLDDVKRQEVEIFDDVGGLILVSHSALSAPTPSWKSDALRACWPVGGSYDGMIILDELNLPHPLSWCRALSLILILSPYINFIRDDKEGEAMIIHLTS